MYDVLSYFHTTACNLINLAKTILALYVLLWSETYSTYGVHSTIVTMDGFASMDGGMDDELEHIVIMKQY